MRILHVNSGNLYGGVETLLATMARLREAEPRLEHHFALCFPGRHADELRGLGAPVALLAPVRFSRPWTVRAARRAMRETLARSRPDAVICHASWTQALVGRAVRSAGLPLVFWQHDVLRGFSVLDLLASRIPPDLAIVNSRAAGATTRRVFPRASPEVLPLPVPAPVAAAGRDEVRRGLGTPAGATVILMAARLSPLKGHAVLIDALGLLRDRQGWRAWIAGGVQRPQDREYLDALTARAAALGVLDRVQFLGHRSDVADLLAASDIYCQPNVGPESFGLSFIEALYSGLPVVTTRIGAACEVVTEDCGVLLPPSDPAALAAALAGLMDDPGRRGRLSAGGPIRARALCDPTAAMGRLADLLARVTAAGAR